MSTSIKISNNLHKNILASNNNNNSTTSQINSNTSIEAFSSLSSTSSSSSSSSSSTSGSTQMISSVETKSKSISNNKPPLITNYKYSNEHHHHHHHMDMLNESRILDSSIQLHNLTQQPNKAFTRFILNSTAATAAANDTPLMLKDINVCGSSTTALSSSNDYSIDSTLRLERNYSYVEAMKDESIVGVALPTLIGDSTSQAANILDNLDNTEFIGFGKPNGSLSNRLTYHQQTNGWVWFYFKIFFYNNPSDLPYTVNTL
jgi:hypothetical protein